MKQLFNKWLNINHLSNFIDFKQLLFNQNCLLCVSPHTNKHALCQACLNDLPLQPKTSCPQCGLTSNGNVCGRCLALPPSFDVTKAVFIYQFPVDAMMTRYKYGEMLNLSLFWGQFLAQNIDAQHIDFIIPMPMHPTRLKERGFNQAHEIAKVLCRVLGSHQLDYKRVARQTLTPPQASLPLKERVKNIKGAFKVSADLSGKRIAVVDDVMTSGASLNELALTLKKAGASHVECWVIARTLPHR
jgi:ComF family protein